MNYTCRRHRGNRQSEVAGFTLAEIAIASTVLGFVMLIFISSFMFIARSAFSANIFVEMNNQERNGLDLFAREMRQAETVVRATTNSITVKIPSSSGTRTVSYLFDSEEGQLIRTEGSWDRAVIKGLEIFSFRFMDQNRNVTGARGSVKIIQVEGKCSATVLGVKDSASIISASFVMRNVNV